MDTVTILKEIRCALNPPCCHNSGMHDSRHFLEKKYVCDGQKAVAFDKVWALVKRLLGEEEAQVVCSDCISVEDCYFCEAEKNEIPICLKCKIPIEDSCHEPYCCLGCKMTDENADACK